MNNRFPTLATIQVGDLPHGIWPSGDGTRVYVGIENGGAVTAIDKLEAHRAKGRAYDQTARHRDRELLRATRRFEVRLGSEPE